jgi:hypothetical protein
MMPHKQNRLSSTFTGQTTINQSLHTGPVIEKGSDSLLLALEKAPRYVSFRAALQKSVLLCETSMRRT